MGIFCEFYIPGWIPFDFEFRKYWIFPQNLEGSSPGNLRRNYERMGDKTEFFHIQNLSKRVGRKIIRSEEKETSRGKQLTVFFSIGRNWERFCRPLSAGITELMSVAAKIRAGHLESRARHEIIRWEGERRRDRICIDGKVKRSG